MNWMGRAVALGVALAISTSGVNADGLQGPQSPSYAGGRGLITLEGPTGMFQNITSGTLKRGDFTTQSCLSFKESNGDNFQWLGTLVSYGVTDWLEVGAFGLFASEFDRAATGKSHAEAGQIYTRIRLLRDEGGLPEFSIGGLVQRGNGGFDKESLFFAASKGVTFDDRHFLRGARVHFGGRAVWQESNGGGPGGGGGGPGGGAGPGGGGDGRINTLFVGAELELVRGLFLVGEVNTEDNSDIKRPFSVGLQYRQGSYGLSLAYVQAGNETEPSAYIGIGVSF